jgi:HK97 family phage portal protein
MFGGGSLSTNVTEDKALGISVLYACINLISDSVASLGWHVLENVAEGKEKALKHPNYNLLHTAPNPQTTSFMFRKTLIIHALLWGNGYALIERDGANRVKAFWIQYPKDVIPERNETTGEIFYQTKSGKIPEYDMIHIMGLSTDGLKGKGVVKTHAEQLGIVLDAQKYGADLFNRGATIGGILSTDINLTPDQQKQLRDAWNADTHGRDNNHKTKVLGGGLKYQRVGLSPEEAQFLLTRERGAYEICSMLQVPPFMVGLTEKSTSWGTGIEQQQIGFLKFCLTPWLKRIEQEVDKKAFREQEKGKFFNSFNVNSLLKADIASQTTHVQAMLDRGVYDINAALNFLDQNTIGELGKKRFVMKNMQPLDRVDAVIDAEISKNTPNTNNNE